MIDKIKRQKLEEEKNAINETIKHFQREQKLSSDAQYWQNTANVKNLDIYLSKY